MSLPEVLHAMILAWVREFNRRDAMDRYPPPLDHQAAMSHVREDIRMNPPTYLFQVLTVHRAHLQLAIHLPDCNPARVHTGLRIPESHIVAWSRRVLAIPPQGPTVRILHVTDTLLTE